MNLKDKLQNLQQQMRTGQFVSEAMVSQGIVLPILNSLDWPVFDTQVVIPEYSTEGKRVDFALCHPANHPIVFMEVKKIGQTQGADRQLFEYAFHRGVPFAVLTDGQEWHFFLPGEQGYYQERRVYKIDVLERDISEAIDRLFRYLSYQRVCSGEALKAARADYQDVAKIRQIEATLPVAWKKLIEEQDELLIEMLAVKVEDICGYKPDPDTCSAYLEQVITQEKQNIVNIQPQYKPAYPVHNKYVAKEIYTPGKIGFLFRGKRGQGFSSL